MCPSPTRKELLEKLDNLTVICDTCITIKYNEQVIGKEKANEFCVFQCPLAPYFKEIGRELSKDIRKQREIKRNGREIRSTTET